MLAMVYYFANNYMVLLSYSKLTTQQEKGKSFTSDWYFLGGTFQDCLTIQLDKVFKLVPTYLTLGKSLNVFESPIICLFKKV